MRDDGNSVFQAKKQYLYSKIWEFGANGVKGRVAKYFPGALVFRPLSPVSRTKAIISRIWRGVV